MQGPSTVLQSENEKKISEWVEFIDTLQSNRNGSIPDPYTPVNALVTKYLSTKGSTNSVLDIGCETGKNSKCLIEAGHKVTILDIAPNAVQYTKKNLEQIKLSDGIVDEVTGDIESLDTVYGPFKAVVGTYAFTFIPPNLFHDVMKNNVLGRVEPEGYFVGGFFGEKHAWAQDPELTIMTQEKLKDLFSSLKFEICEMVEEVTEKETVLEGTKVFHTIDVIAKRIM